MDDVIAGHGDGSSGDGQNDWRARADPAVTGRFELSLPPDSRYIRLARLMASGIATSCGLTLAEIEDVRIAVDEVCATLIEVGDSDAVRLTFELTGEALIVAGGVVGAPGESIDSERLSLSRQILDVVTDDHSLQRSGDTVSFTVRKLLRARGVG